MMVEMLTGSPCPVCGNVHSGACGGRPLYETPDSLSNERRILELIENEWDCRCPKLPLRYSVDSFAIRNGTIVAVVEVKRRQCAMAKYNTLILSLEKYLEGVKYMRELNAPFYFVVEWDDGIGYWNAAKWPMPSIMIGGRKDRNDWQDQEPVIHIPIEQCELISGGSVVRL